MLDGILDRALQILPFGLTISVEAVRADGSDGDGAPGSAHDFDPRSRGVGDGIGKGGRGRAHRRGRAL